MYKLVNNTAGDISSLEQIINAFFPFLKDRLGFDKPVNIVMHSDQENANVLLGKTAHYDPSNYEIYVYTDGRHPKDILRSLSHELVHHAQNCRGDFSGVNSTDPGYAQNDPHMRNMEEEAYTEGNLGLRDFEDLIKTGKINIEIDFSDSGEPKMSLKEWKNNEINTKLMKKWGFLKESKEVTTEDTEDLEEGCGDVDYAGEEEELEEGNAGVWTRPSKSEEKEMKQAEKDAKKSGTSRTAGKGGARGRRNVVAKTTIGGVTAEQKETQKKISVREAKEITRRIIERIKLENK